ncbi:short-chain dehydrogenase [Erwinia sp. OLTSP20]|uniref:SDR family oxidoreductase n=1 Tax=unclassified Erwinia TaxID=2622719 RepID=UPI000C1A36D6|nr:MULTISPECIES: SDR family oxidoreductase [unclassified Erwinia]PIJ50425.1 short-chain dehydrogenase [Erwinia sp. OAMSP11]PIJ72496.1 short-chain dehydrogenase [Erwinia sp. OLSSP12]PIJ81734.1 short-chain dehydrogenase [Erwinia sp. OLCASP19]PIJ84327.1 short-chain dehydrogenase [Erwinia sp. OLMTSP26]PIJ86191.1 short-chain dehydrogenase [Erwinia sp. OLMDSP33]
MKLKDAVVLVTGASRGLGQQFAQRALEMGARKVYACARHPQSVTVPGAIPVRLDVTRPEDIVAAAAQCQDVTLLINNAGIAQPQPLLSVEAEEALEAEMNVNLLGPLRVSRAFAPLLAANGGGAIINVLSVASWINSPRLITYSISKSAAWSMTNGLRQALLAQKTQVLALHAGFIDTDLTRQMDVPKVAPLEVVNAAFKGLEEGASEVLADDITRRVHNEFSTHPEVYQLAIRR